MEQKQFKELSIDSPDDALDAPYPVPRGMKAWKNVNGFTVLAVHYTADPKKRSNEWYAQACSRLRPDQIERELELNFDSKAGAKAFPFLEMNEGIYRADPPNPIPSHWKIIAGMDYGARNPTCVQWYGVDEHLRFWLFDEFYMPLNQLKGGLPALCDYIKKHPYYDRCSKIAADPKIFARDQNIVTKETGMPAWGTIKSIAEMMIDEKIHKVQRANNDRILGLTRLNTMFNWRGTREESKPMLIISPRCKNTWKELVNIVYKLNDSQEKNPEDDVIKSNDHAYDAVRYSLLCEDLPPYFVNRMLGKKDTLADIEREMDEKRAEEERDVYACTFNELDSDFDMEYYV